MSANAMTPRPWFLALLVALGCSNDKLPVGEIVLFIDTDAIVAEPLGTPVDSTRLSPLVDRARIEVLLDGRAHPGSTRDFVIDAAMFRAREVSFGIVPPAGVTTVSARVLLFRADRVIDNAPEPGAALETIVALPPVPNDGTTELSVILRTDDFGARIGPISPSAGSGAPSLVGTWRGGHRIPCNGGSRPGETCVPGGAYFLGTPQLRGRTANDISAERLVYLSPFFLDTTEVTVGELRKVMPSLSARGLPPPFAFNGRPFTDDFATAHFTDFCTWTDAPGSEDRERLPVSCTSWTTAHAYCLEVGKDLPSEAQIEYVTTGLGEEWAFPWGNDEPDCRAAIWGQGGAGVMRDNPQQCRKPSTIGGPTFPGTGTSDSLDSNVLHNAGGSPIVDLGGNLSEWALDTWGLPTDAFWGTTRLMVDPVDSQPSPLADEHVARGGNWSLSALTMRGGFRQRRHPAVGDAVTGFRCARNGRDR